MPARRIAFALIGLIAAAAAGWYYCAKIQDQVLDVNTEVIAQLQAMTKEEKFRDLPGVDTTEEVKRNEENLNELLVRLESGIQQNPRKRWVLEQMQPTIGRMYLEDTEVRERFVDYLTRVDGILGIRSTSGAFARYLIFF